MGMLKAEQSCEARAGMKKPKHQPKADNGCGALIATRMPLLRSAAVGRLRIHYKGRLPEINQEAFTFLIITASNNERIAAKTTTIPNRNQTELGGFLLGGSSSMTTCA